MSTIEERAAQRHALWEGRVVEAGAAKEAAYISLTAQERLRALTRLNERAWIATGRSMPPATPRAEWPAEVFEIRRRG